MHDDSAQWKRVRIVLDEVLETPREQREEALARLTSADAALRTAVERLLEQESTHVFGSLDQARDAALRELGGDGAPRLAPGDVLGAYQVERLLGRGGMGEVYAAAERATDRRVALKVLAGRLHSTDERSRFRYEAEVLARLRHPGIARVFAAGSADDVPFIAMELVQQAEDLRAFVRRSESSVEEIVALMRAVCEAVAYAHRQGVIHRDLKPSNLVVGADGAPKVIDFGIARGHGPGGVERATRTRTGAVVGTLAYMSPEGWEGRSDTVDTRSDVYSLGVVLQELLCGRRPFDVDDLPFSEAHARVTRSEPVTPRHVRPELPAQLDWITRRALERDPERRYASAGELGADLERFLRGEPVSVGPPTRSEWVRRFVRRHRVAVGAVTVVGTGLVLGAVGLAVGLVRAQRAEVLAQDRFVNEREARATAEAVTDFLVDLPRWVDASERGGNVPLAEVLRGASHQLEERFGDEPQVEARLRATLGSSLHPLGEHELARTQLERALELERSAAEPSCERRIELLLELAEIARETNQLPRGDDLLSEAEALARAHRPDDERLRLRLALGRARGAAGERGPRAKRLSELHAACVRAFGADDGLTLECGEAWASLWIGVSPSEHAVRIADELLEAVARRDRRDPDVLRLRLLHARALEHDGQFQAALAELKALQVASAETFGADSFAELSLVPHVARLQNLLGQSVAAEALLRRALDLYTRRYGSNGRLGFALPVHLAEVLLIRTRYAEADSLALDVLERAPVNEHTRLRLYAWGVRAKALFALGDAKAAEEALSAGIDEWQAAPDAPPELAFELDKLLALTLVGQDRFEDAEEVLERALDVAERNLPAQLLDVAFLRTMRGQVFLGTGRLEDARVDLEDSYDDLRGIHPDQPDRWAAPLIWLDRTYQELGRDDLREHIAEPLGAAIQALQAQREAP